jgi:hypothetical protein
MVRITNYPHCWWIYLDRGGHRILRIAKPWSHRQRDVWGPKLLAVRRGIKGET